MKISRLRLKNVQQFKDIEINLTYPKGHPREGQPLDKVCFIGQSGTGKTTLLRFIKLVGRTNILDSWNEISNSIHITQDSFFEADHVHKNFKYSSYLESPYPENEFWGKKVIKWKNFVLNNNPFDHGTSLSVSLSQADGSLYKDFFRPKIDVIHFPVGFQFLETNSQPTVNRNMSEREMYQTLDFGNYNVKLLWYEIQDVLQRYSEELASLLYNANAAKQDRDKKLKEFDEWESNHPSILKEIGDRYLNRILAKFQLEVDTEINPTTLSDYRFIPIKHLNDKVTIHYHLLNSASQNIIYTSVPLFYYAPKDSIILIDEVENSLYPDVQTSIVNDYVNIAPGNQFFFSTHSPLIASTFDPWEIVELKFDKSGEIYQDTGLKDVEKGRHINNYKVYPKYLRWDSILTDVFDIDFDGNPERDKLLTSFAEVKKMMEYKISNKLPYQEEELEYNEIAEKLRWWKTK